MVSVGVSKLGCTLQDRPRGYFSPYSQSYHSIFLINVTSDGVLLIKDVLSVIESASLDPLTPKFETKVIRIRIQIFGLIWINVRQNCGYTRRRHSFRQVWFKSAVDCMRTEKTEKC